MLDELEASENTFDVAKSDLRLDLSDMIFRFLTETGWTQQKLADACGMKAPALTRIMHGRTNCTFDTATRIILAMGLKSKLSGIRAQQKRDSQGKTRKQHR